MSHARSRLDSFLAVLSLSAALGATQIGCATAPGSNASAAPRTAVSHERAEVVERTDAQRRARMHYEVALDRMSSGRNPEAIGELLMAVRLDPNEQNVRLALAEAFRRAGRMQDTETHLLAALQITPDFHDARFNLAALYIELERYAEAIVETKRLLDDPTFPRPWRALTNAGWAEYKLGRLDEAAAHLQLALDYKEDYWPARLNLGILESERGHRTEAAAHFERVLEIPSGPSAEAEARYRLAELYLAMGDRRGAIAQLNKASILRPSGPWGRRSAETLQSLQ
jgi:Tfp pilus assembly protein PilF